MAETPTAGLRPGSSAWRIAHAVREYVLHGARDRFESGYALVWYVERELATLATSPEPSDDTRSVGAAGAGQPLNRTHGPLP
jgi:hypothetical protein